MEFCMLKPTDVDYASQHALRLIKKLKKRNQQQRWAVSRELLGVGSWQQQL
jgi:hypothetical protein